jgi:alpha-ketoglutarate-dependent taurine dioxygenase
MLKIDEQIMPHGRHIPLVLRPSTSDRDLGSLVTLNRPEIDQRLLVHGALLFRGFAVESVDKFDQFVGSVAKQRVDYVYGSSPRTSVGDRIFTATEYPPALEITPHNENAYQRRWPLKIAFYCLKPALAGGETPVVDMRRVTATIGPELLDKFATLGVRYTRNYRPHVDVSWQSVFQTDSRNVVAQFCRDNDIEHEWINEETLRTTQVCQGTARHPLTGEQLFFNQAHMFHVTALGAEGAASLVGVFGRDELPRHAHYGDGSEISHKDLDTLRSALAQESISFSWQTGDVLLLDNMRVAHGRRPFKGPRKILASLMDLYAPP